MYRVRRRPAAKVVSYRGTDGASTRRWEIQRGRRDIEITITLRDREPIPRAARGREREKDGASRRAAAQHDRTFPRFLGSQNIDKCLPIRQSNTSI